MIACPSEEQLRRLLADQLAADEVAALDAHIEACPSCRQVLGRLSAEGSIDTRLLQRPASDAEHQPRPDFLRNLANTLVMPGSDAESAMHPAGSEVRFQIVRRHDQGGLGVVFVARDTELGREVALKEIQGEFAHDPDAQARFLAEAEITGRLEHPGIVPVYGLGRYADGRPFYATRFIQGESLRTALKRLHEQAHAADPGQQSLELRRLLGRFVEACNTIAYAHSRGVLHRDLKPEHIMLGPYGETFVVDWGIAKLIGQHEATTAPAAPAPLPPPSGMAKTLEGSVLGTPQYMSPEQASGQGDQLRPASDVYSLGATLYYLLTGRPPFDEPDLYQLLQRVYQGDFLPPRQVKRDVPRALEAICLKAMARKPEDRYVSPRGLAGDIERWLAGEPVTAYPEPLSARLGRWARRHKALVGVAASLLALIATAAIAWRLVTAAEDQTTQEKNTAAEMSRLRDEADAGRREAETQRNEVRRILNRSVYGSQIFRSYLEWKEDRLGNMQRKLDWLQANVPEGPNGTDHGFEWHYLRRLEQGGYLAWPWSGGKEGVDLAFSADSRHLAVLDRQKQHLAVTDVGSGQEVFSADEVACFAFDADGKRLAEGLSDGTVVVRESASGRELHRLRGHQGAIEKVLFRPDGKQMASTAADQTIKVWDLATGREQASFPGFSHGVSSLAFSPDSQRLAAGTYEQIHIWGLKDNKERPGTEVRLVTFSELRFSADSQRVLAQGYRFGFKTLIVWDYAAAATRFRLLAQADTVVSPDGRLAASICKVRDTDLLGQTTEVNDTTMQLWDAVTGRETRTLTGKKELSGAQFSPDGQLLAARDDKAVVVWDTMTGAQRFVREGEGREFTLIGFAPSGRWLACKNHQTGTIEMHAVAGRDISSWPLSLKARPGTLTDWCISPDGRRFATAAFDGMVRLWDLTYPQEERQLWQSFGSVRELAFSPDGSRLAQVASDPVDQTIVLWDTVTGEQLTNLGPHLGSETLFAFTPDGSRIVTVGGKSWEVAGAKEVPSDSHPPGEPLAVAATAEGQIVAARRVGKQVVLWDQASGKVIRSLGDYPDGVARAAFSAGATRLALACNEGEKQVRIDIWDVQSGRLLGSVRHQYEDSLLESIALVFSPDGRRLASAVHDRTIALWDVATGQALRTLEGHSQPVASLAFSADGERLASGGWDNQVKVWDPETGQELLSLSAHQTTVTAVAFSRDGRRLASGDSTGMVYLWDGSRTPAEVEAHGQHWLREQAKKVR